MHTILRIISVEKKQSKDGSSFYYTWALLDNQEEHRGFGNEFAIGDEVEAFWNDKWDYPQMIKPEKTLTLDEP